MSLSPPEPVTLDGSAFRFGIVTARYNPELVTALREQVETYLRAARVSGDAITTWQVPGSNEIPVAVAGMLRHEKSDAVIALGVIIRGSTLHYELIAHATAQALQQVAVQAAVPVINGIVVAENEDQARERCAGAINRGAEFAWSALEMAALRRKNFPGP